MSFTGERPGRPPVKCGAPLSDITAGILAAMGILAAYTHRLKTGEGQWVETSLYEAALVQTYWQSAIALADRRRADGDGLGASAQRALPGVRGLRRLDRGRRRQPEELAAHARGARRDRTRRTIRASSTAPTAWRHLKELEAELSAALPQPDRRAIGWRCWTQKGVPCGPVHDMLQALADPQTIAREMVVEVAHSTLGQVKTIGLPVKFSQTPRQGAQRRAAVMASTAGRYSANYGFSPTMNRRLGKRRRGGGAGKAEMAA